MGRREMIALPGIAALTATRAFAQAGLTAGGSRGHVSKKSIGKLTGAKAAYKVPKSASKQAKYINSLSVLLSLSAAQQQMAQVIFSNAGSVSTSLDVSLKAARQALSQAVRNNDNGGISQAAGTLGQLKGQHAANGAVANAAFFQILTADQQARLAQFQG